MAVRSVTRVVLTSRQLLVAQVAVTLCSDVIEFDLGDWESRRVALGEEFGVLARRLAGARDLDAASGAQVVSLLDASGQPVLAVELPLAVGAVRVLRVAAERMRGIIAQTGLFEDLIGEELDLIVDALP